MKAQKKMPCGCLDHSRRAVLPNGLATDNKISSLNLESKKQMNTNNRKQDQQIAVRGAA